MKKTHFILKDQPTVHARGHVSKSTFRQWKNFVRLFVSIINALNVNICIFALWTTTKQEKEKKRKRKVHKVQSIQVLEPESQP